MNLQQDHSERNSHSLPLGTFVYDRADARALSGLKRKIYQGSAALVVGCVYRRLGTDETPSGEALTGPSR